MTSSLRAFRRDSNSVGVRNHVLVLPSVVCSSHAAVSVAGEGPAIAIAHQHGCLHVGDDLVHTEAALVGAAVSQNVAATVVVSLGCETLNGKRLAKHIGALGQNVELIGIQAAGGTQRAIEAGRRVVARLVEDAAGQPRIAITPAALQIGIDDGDHPLADRLVEAFEGRGIKTLLPPPGLKGPEAHVWLTTERAHAIVSLPAEDEGPIGFAVSPVVAVSRGCALHEALAGDFDVIRDRRESDHAFVARVMERVLDHCNGTPTAAERRGARDFVVHRLAVTL